MKMMNKLIISLSCILLVGCSGSLPDSGGQQGEGEPIDLSFNLYNVVVSKADEKTKPTVKMAVGTAFRIYAFKAGETDLTKPIASAVYTVKDENGKSEGNLSLYRGSYDFYMISNNTNTAPVLDSGANSITVDNGNDFMYNIITNEVIQPEKPGENKMTVSLRTPFSRLGSKVDLSVKANGNSPIKVTKLEVQSITIKNLSSPLSYELGKKDWNTSNPSYTKDNLLIVSGFTKPEETSDPHSNENPVVLLPISGLTDLLFELVLTVEYPGKDDKGNSIFISDNFTYQASVTKALIKGMGYKFDFTLTFFGILKPGDITVSLLDYTEENLSTDQVGE